MMHGGMMQRNILQCSCTEPTQLNIVGLNDSAENSNKAKLELETIVLQMCWVTKRFPWWKTWWFYA